MTYPMQGYDLAADSQRQTCKMCGCKQYFEFHVPDWLWEAVVPERYRQTALCLSCFDACCFEAGMLDWAGAIDYLAFVGRYATFGLKPDLPLSQRMMGTEK